MVGTKHPNPQARYRAAYRCIEGCPGEYPLDRIIYRCPACGDLLDVVHDLGPLRMTLPGEWKQVLDGRSQLRAGPWASGVWDKKEMVCPAVADENIVSTGEGRTPLVRAELLGRRWGTDELWIKQCGHSHTGSFKDLGMTVLVSMVRQMRAQGLRIPAVACASTGDTSAALAAYCAAAGIPAVVFLPRGRVSAAQLVQPLAHGAITLAIDTDFDGCMRLVREVTGSHDIYLANSMNPLRIEGQKTVAIELCQQLGWQIPDAVVVPGGNLGNVSALGRGFLLLRDLGLIARLPRLVCAQAENANPLYRSYRRGFQEYAPVAARPTAASAIQIGDPVSIKRAIRALQQCEGIVEQASEEELAAAAAAANAAGLYCCPHTAVALAALRKLLQRGELRHDARIVVISTAHGLKFTSFQQRLAAPPLEVEADYDKVCGAVLRALEAWERKTRAGDAAATGSPP
jgi:threonine synthase